VLCTVLHDSGIDAPYKPTHRKHPICVWASESLSNWKWIQTFVSYLNAENKFRYGKDHKSAIVAAFLPDPNIDDIGPTPFPMAFSNVYKGDNLEESYRKYYICEKKIFKSGVAKWTNRPIPYWMREGGSIYATKKKTTEANRA